MVYELLNEFLFYILIVFGTVNWFTRTTALLPTTVFDITGTINAIIFIFDGDMAKLQF